MAEVRELQEQCNKELADAGYGDSVGECGFWEGMIPIWGSGKDMINDIQTGDYGWAVFNGVFLVWDVASVVVGVFSLGTGTLAMQGAKVGITQGLKTGIKAFSAKALKQIGKQAFKKLTKEMLKKSIDDVAKKILKVCVFACFPAGTPVHTATGIRPIETILLGDLVWSYNEDTGEIDLKEVLLIMEREVDVTVKLTIGEEIIETTAEHPFFTADGWKDAAELETGELILRKDEEDTPVLSVDFEYIPKKVFNFEVADWHTYFVGILAWVVHNAGRCLSEIASNIRNIVKIVGIEDDIIIFSAKVGDEVVEGIANFVVKDGKLFLNQLHLQGSAAGKVGRTSLWEMAKDLGKQYGVEEVVIQGGKRTTGKYVGKVPSQIIIKTN